MLLVLAIAVSSGVFWQLRLTGLSLTGDAYCGHMEHQHSDSCRERTLICAQGEKELLCTLPEHVHGEECYEITYTCGFAPEYDHIHTLQCYSNPEADLETPEMWQRSVSSAILTGNPAEDLVAVAETQLGYRESRSNYTVGSDGVSYRGYTRYGHWYGDPYSRWGALFVSFCLHFAHIPQETVCRSAEIASWPAALVLQEAYESSADYTGKVGDIIFFDTDGDAAADSVGIVSHVSQESFTVISYGRERAVTAGSWFPEDRAIMGYAPVSRLPTSDLFAGETRRLAPKGSAVELGSYVSDHNGTITIQLLDKNGNLMQGSTVYENEDYQLAFDVDLRGKNGQPGHGFTPGIYYYQMPANVSFIENAFGDYDEDDIKNNTGQVFGHWHVDPASNRLVFEFYPNSDLNQDVRINLKFGAEFTWQQTPIDFDGLIQVTILPAEEYTPPTASLTKTGTAKDDNGTPAIAWTLTIQGSEEYPLSGMTLVDTCLAGDFTMNRDYSLWIQYCPPNAMSSYYAQYVPRGQLNWTSTGWTYTLPASFTCAECLDPRFHEGGNPNIPNTHISHTIHVGDDWLCYIYYSTPIGGSSTAYQNKIEGGGKTDVATVLPSSGAGIVKTGRMENGNFKWTIDLNIPGGRSYGWNGWDSASVKGAGIDSSLFNDMSVCSVQAGYNGEWIDVPVHSRFWGSEYKPSTPIIGTASDPFLFVTTTYDSGCQYDIYSKCTCSDADHCRNWDYGSNTCKGQLVSTSGVHYCACWDEAEAVPFRVTYEMTNSAEIISEYGGNDNRVSNWIELSGFDREGGQKLYNGGSTGRITIPGVFTKKLLARADGDNRYIAKFSISVNEELRDLSQEIQGGVVTIVDEMSASLFYVQGSMVITRQDAAGNVTTLTSGDDYTIAVSSDFHRLTIDILDPGAYLYRLEYNAAVNVAGSSSGVLVYDNSATVTLLGQRYSATIDQQTLSDFSSTAENFRVTITKTDRLDPAKRLAGAGFGLYNKNGGLIISGYTGSTPGSDLGKLTFQTNITQGIVFCTDEPYYLQELEAPAGYVADDTRYWFYFADLPNSTLEADYPDISRFPAVNSIYAGDMTIENAPYAPVLPATGGSGSLPFVIGGMLLAAAPLLYRSISRRKYRERRNSNSLPSG